MFWVNLIIALDPINGDLLSELVEKYEDRLYAVTYTELRVRGMENVHDTEDLVQDTFVKVYFNIGRFRGLTDEETIKLLTVYAKNTAKDFVKKAEHKYHKEPFKYDEEDEPSYDIPDTAPTPEDMIITEENVKRITGLVEQLTDEQRHTFMLKYEFGYSNKEIAATLNITETNVSTRLNRARKELVKMMKEDNHGQDNK